MTPITPFSFRPSAGAASGPGSVVGSDHGPLPPTGALELDAPASVVAADLRLRFGPDVFERLLLRLTRKRFGRDKAERIVLAALDRRRELSRRLNRRVGFLTALCDEMTSVDPLFEQPMLVETLTLLEYESHALLDHLTGLPNRRSFDRELTRALTRGRRRNESVSLILLDLDDFKRYNDRFGHPAGDQGLALLGRTLQSVVRGDEFPARFGGEEFAVVLPGAGLDEALACAERIRVAAADCSFEHACFTVSLGAASFPEDGHSPAELVAAADRRLYIAKQRRKNRVCSRLDDLREHPRKLLTGELRFAPADLGLLESGFVETGLLIDASLSGLLFAAERRLTAGMRIGVRFPFMVEDDPPLFGPIVREAGIERRKLRRFGLCFDAPLSKDRFEALIRGGSG